MRSALSTMTTSGQSERLCCVHDYLFRHRAFHAGCGLFDCLCCTPRGGDFGCAAESCEARSVLRVLCPWQYVLQLSPCQALRWEAPLSSARQGSRARVPGLVSELGRRRRPLLCYCPLASQRSLFPFTDPCGICCFADVVSVNRSSTSAVRWATARRCSGGRTGGCTGMCGPFSKLEWLRRACFLHTMPQFLSGIGQRRVRLLAACSSLQLVRCRRCL